MSRVAARDSGKPMLDAAFGEVTVTCVTYSRNNYMLSGLSFISVEHLPPMNFLDGSKEEA